MSSSFAAAANNPFTGSFDQQSGTISWVLKLATAGTLSATTRALYVSVTGSDNSIKQRTVTRVELQKQIDDNRDAGLGALASIDIRDTFQVEPVNTLFLSVYEEFTDDTNAQIVNSGSNPFDGIIQVVGQPSSPVVSIVSSTLAAGSGANVSVSAMTLKVAFGSSNGGSKLSKYNIIIQKRFENTVSAVNILNKSIIDQNIDDGYVQYALVAGDLANLVNMATDTTLVIRASVDNSDRESVLSPTPALLPVSLRLSPPVIESLTNGNIDKDSASYFKLRVRGLPTSINTTWTNLLIEARSVDSGNYALFANVTRADIIDEIRSKGYADVKVSMDATPAAIKGLTAYQVRAYASNAASVSSTSPVQSLASNIVKTISTVQPQLQTAALYSTYTDPEHKFTQSITGVAASVASTTSLFAEVQLFKNNTLVQTIVQNLTSGSAPADVEFRMNKSLVSQSDTLYTNNTTYAMVTAMPDATLITNDATLLSTPVKIIISSLSSKPIVPKPITNTSSSPTLAINYSQTLTVAAKRAIGFAWLLRNVSTTYPIHSIELEVATGNDFNSLTVITTIPSTRKAYTPTDEYQIVQNYGGAGTTLIDFSASTAVLMRFRAVYGWEGQASNESSIEGDWVNYTVITPANTPMVGPDVTQFVFVSGNTMKLTPKQVAATATYAGDSTYAAVQYQFSLLDSLLNVISTSVVPFNPVGVASGANLEPIMYTISSAYQNTTLSVKGVVQYKNSKGEFQNSSVNYSAEVYCPILPVIQGIQIIETLTTIQLIVTAQAGELTNAQTGAVTITALLPYMSSGSAAFSAPVTWVLANKRFESTVLTKQDNAALYTSSIVGYIVAANGAGVAFRNFPM
jgi:hypothetical protein